MYDMLIVFFVFHLPFVFALVLFWSGLRVAVAPAASRLGAVTRGESSLNMAVKKPSKKVRHTTYDFMLSYCMYSSQTNQLTAVSTAAAVLPTPWV